MKESSLLFINQIAAMICGGDPHCRVFMFGNIHCRLKGNVLYFMKAYEEDGKRKGENQSLW